MKSKISDLDSTELRIYAELAYVSKNGFCDTPITVMRRRCELNSYQYKKALKSLEDKGLISQKIISNGVPRVIKLQNC